MLEAHIDNREEGQGGFGRDIDQSDLNALEELGVVHQADLQAVELVGDIDQADGAAARGRAQGIRRAYAAAGARRHDNRGSDRPSCVFVK